MMLLGMALGLLLGVAIIQALENRQRRACERRPMSEEDRRMLALLTRIKP